MTIHAFRQLAMSFPGVEEKPHFDRAAFKVTGKRIFTTLHTSTQTVNVRLLPKDQATFCEYEAGTIYPVPNKWGQQGWTTVDLGKIPEDLMLDMLETAYQEAKGNMNHG